MELALTIPKFKYNKGSFILNKVIFWTIIIIIILTILWLISDIFSPFFIAAIISYILQPVIDRISFRYNLPRRTVATASYILFLSVFAVVIIVLLPIIYQQISLLISKLPAYNAYVQEELMPSLTEKINSVDPNIGDRIKDSISNIANSIFSLITTLANNIWHYTVATINIVIFIVLTPVVLFYFLRDWSKMIKSIKSLLPFNSRLKIQEILLAINNLLSAYMRGQLNICLLLSAYYGIALSLIGVDLGILLGILSGFLIIIPFIGTLISVSLTMIIGYFAFGTTIKLGYILLTYIVGHIIESYILTPKIIGDKIGLHPLWIMFAVLACGSLFGFIGIFFAIPIAGIIKVLYSFAIKSYKGSKFYRT